MTKEINGALFSKMITNAAAAIENHKQEVNELNVFPVPDGDTGTNMSLTIEAGEKALAAIVPDTLGHTAEVTASALLRGARGNSGVILSLLFRGLARSLKDSDTASAVAFANAMMAGVESAYKAVMKPAEGTILTVSKVTAATASDAALHEDDIESVLEQAIAEGRIALAETTNQNPVLKKAGVIDAGAQGYLYILDGMLKALRGEVVSKKKTDSVTDGKADFAMYSAEDITFAYCTEFIVERNQKTGTSDVNNLREFLNARGDSIVVVDDDEIIKVHVHSNEPGVILTEALTYGALLTIKIENMHEQHSETLINETAASPSKEKEPPSSPSKEKEPPSSKLQDSVQSEEQKSYGIVAVCAGAGIEEVFKDLGADKLIIGGQTMNPSTEDILEKINATPSETVFVLPNNKNIIMAAEQCMPLSKKRIFVIPTRSIPQGVSALLAVDNANEIDDIAENMTQAAKRVHTVLITRAARDSTYDGCEIKEGEYIALLEDSLIINSSVSDDVIESVASVLKEFSPEFITVFAGEEVNDDEASSVMERISVLLPGAEASIIPGGQPVYNYIISAE